MNKTTLRNFALFFVIFICCILCVTSCPTSPIVKTYTITFSSDDGVSGIVINGQKIITNKGGYKHSVRSGESVSFDIETSALYRVKTISDQVVYTGGKGYSVTPKKNTEINIKTVKRVSSDSSLLFIRADEGIETVTFIQSSEGTLASQTLYASNTSMCFEKDSRSDGNTIIVRPRSGYKVDSVKGAVLQDSANNEYSLSGVSNNIVITSASDSEYVNEYKTVILNYNGGVSDTSVIFYKDGKFYSDNKDGSEEISQLNLPLYPSYVITFDVSEENIVVVPENGTEDNIITNEDIASYNVDNYCTRILTSQSDVFATATDDGRALIINPSVVPFEKVEEYTAETETDSVLLPVIKQNVPSESATKKFLGWGSSKKLSDVVPSPYTPLSSLTLYDKWEDMSYTFRVSISGENNGVIKKGIGGDIEYTSGEYKLSKQNPLIFRIVANEGYTYTFDITDGNGEKINPDSIILNNGIYEYTLTRDTVKEYTQINLSVKFGRFPQTVLSENVQLVNSIHTDNLTDVPEFYLTVDSGNVTKDKWDTVKLSEGVDITDNVVLTLSDKTTVPLTAFGDTLRAILYSDGSDPQAKRALVTIQGLPYRALPTADVNIINLSMGLLYGRTETDSITVTSASTLKIKESVKFVFEPSLDEQGIKNRLDKVTVDSTNLLKERTYERSSEGNIAFNAEKDVNLLFTPIFEKGYALDSANPFEPSNIITKTDIKDKFNIFASVFEEENRITVASRIKSIRLQNTDVKLDYQIGDTSSREITLNLVNDGFELSENLLGVRPEIYVMIDSKPVSIDSPSVGSSGFTWRFSKTDTGFKIVIYPKSTLSASLPSSGIKIIIPSSAFVGELNGAEVLDITQTQNLVIYPSAYVNGSLKAAADIDVSEMRTSSSLTFTSESVLNSDIVKEEGYDITEYITLGDRELSSLGDTFKATLYPDNNSNGKTGYIMLSGKSTSDVSLSNLNFSLKAQIFKGFENDERIISTTGNATLEILPSVKLTFAASATPSDGHRDKLSKVVVFENDHIKEKTLLIPSEGDKKAEMYVLKGKTVKFALEFDDLHSLDQLSPFTPSDLVTILPSSEPTYEIAGDKLTENKEVVVSSVYKNVMIENTSLDLTYSVGDTASKESVFYLVSSGYITAPSVSGIVPSVTVKKNTESVSVTSPEVGGVGFSVNLQKRSDSKDGFVLTLAPKSALTASFVMSDISITIPKAAFTNADNDIKVVLSEGQKFVVYPNLSATGNIVAVKGIGDDLSSSSRTFTLSSSSVWSDTKVGADENNATDITDRVLVNGESISAYNLSAYISFISGSLTKTRTAVKILGEPSRILDESAVSFNIDSSFFAGFEDTSFDIKKSSESAIQIKDSVVFTVKASAEQQGITDNLMSVVISSSENIKERILDIGASETKTVSVNVEKDADLEFKPSFFEGYALDNTAPFTPSDAVLLQGGKYSLSSSLFASDYTLSIKTVQREVFVPDPLDLVFNVGDDALVNKQIPLTVKGYVLQDVLPSSVTPEVYVTILGEDVRTVISSTVVGGRGFNATLQKNDTGDGLVVTLSPKQKLTSSYKVSSISIALPSAVFRDEDQKVNVTGDNINNAHFVVYPSSSTSSIIKLIQNASSSDLLTSPVIKVQSDTKWNKVLITDSGMDVSTQILIGENQKLLGEYGDDLKGTLSIDPLSADGKTALIKITGTPGVSTNELSEPISLRFGANLFEGFENSRDTTIKCLSQNASFLIDKSTKVTFETDSSSEDTNRLISVGVSADGLINKTYNIENGSVSLYVKRNKNVNFSLSFEQGYAASSSPFESSSVSVVNSGDLMYPYRALSEGSESVNVKVTSVKKDVFVPQGTGVDLTFRASQSTSSDVKNILVVVNGYKLKDDITGIEPLIYASVNGNDVLLTSTDLGGVGFNTTMQKRTDGTVGLLFKISPKNKLTSYLERSLIKVVIPKTAFVNESEDVTVSGLDNTYIVVYPSVTASLSAAFVQNVHTSSLNNAPIISLKSDAVWNIPDGGREIKDIISLETVSSSSSLFKDDYSALLVKDESDSTGKSAIIKFSGTPKEALSAITSLKYSFNTSYFEGQFIPSSSDENHVSVFVTNNSSKIVIYPSYKVTFKISTENEDTGKLQSVRILKSDNIKESDVLSFDTSLPVAERYVSVYLQKSKTVKALLTFEDGYSLSPENAYTPSPAITISGLGTEGSPMTIGDGVLTSDTEIIISSIKRGIYLTSVTPTPESGKGIEYRIGDTTTKIYEFNINMDGYQKSANPVGNARVMIKRSNGELVNITSTEIGGTGFYVSSNTGSASYDFIVSIRPNASLTQALSDGTIVIYLPSTYIKDAVSDIEVVGGDNLRTFKIYPSVNLSGAVKLVNNVSTDMLNEEQVLTLTSQTPFNSEYVLQNSDVTDRISIGSNKLSYYGAELKAMLYVSEEDESGKTAKIKISGNSTRSLTTSTSLSVNLTASFFSGFEETDDSAINVTSTARMDISESVYLTFKRNTEEEKSKTIGVTILSTSRIKSTEHQFKDTDTVSRYAEKGNALRFIIEYEYGYYIDSVTPFVTVPDITIVKGDTVSSPYEIPVNALTQNSEITINTVKKAVLIDSISDAMKFKIGDGSDKKINISLKANGLVIKKDITGIQPVISAVLNGQEKNLTTDVGGRGFDVTFTKRSDSDGFNIELSPASALTESLIKSPLKISLPESLFENASSSYDVENIDSEYIVIYPSSSSSGRVETYYGNEISTTISVPVVSETQWNREYILQNDDITSIVSIGNAKNPLTFYGSSLKARIIPSSDDSSGKTVVVKFSGSPNVYLKTETVMNFAFTANYFSGFENDNEAITTLSSVMFTVEESQGEQIPLITVNGKDLSYSTLNETSLSVNIPESEEGKDLYLVITNPQYTSLPSPRISGYDAPVQTNNLLTSYLYEPSLPNSDEELLCATAHEEDRYASGFKGEYYNPINANNVSALSDTNTLPIWKNPYEDLSVGDKVYLNDEKYLYSGSEADPKPGLYRTAASGYEKVDATLRYKRSVNTPKGEKELLIFVEDDVWDTDLSYASSQITNRIDNAFVQSVADGFLRNGENDIYGIMVNSYGEEWGEVEITERAVNYFYAKTDGTTYSENVEYIGVTNQIVLFFARLNGEQTMGNTLGYFTAAHLQCNSSSANKSNQSVCLTINAFRAAYDLNRSISTVAHEFQHAIHNYQRKMKKGYDPDGQYINSLKNANADTWVNEMFSVLAQDAVCNTLGDYGPAYQEDNGISLAGISSGRIPGYFQAQRFGVTDWNKISKVLHQPYSASTYGLVYSLGSYIVRNYGNGFIENYLSSDEHEYASSSDMPSSGNGYDNEKSNAKNMILQAVRSSSAENANVTWADILQGWGAAVLLSDNENAKVPYKLVNNNGADYWYNGVYKYGIKIPSINYYNFKTSAVPNTLYDDSPALSTTGPYVFNSLSDRSYDVLPENNTFYGDTNTYVLLSSDVEKGVHTYTLDGNENYKYSLVLK